MKKIMTAVLVLVFGLMIGGTVNQAEASTYRGTGGYKKAAYKQPYKKAAYHKPMAKKAAYNAHVYADRSHMAGVGGTNWTHQPDGKILLTFDQRHGATCHVAYTENRGDMPAYQYRTAVECANGRAVIGGLEPGMNYKFQVSPDHHGWSGEQPSAQAVAVW